MPSVDLQQDESMEVFPKVSFPLMTCLNADIQGSVLYRTICQSLGRSSVLYRTICQSLSSVRQLCNIVSTICQSVGTVRQFCNIVSTICQSLGTVRQFYFTVPTICQSRTDVMYYKSSVYTYTSVQSVNHWAV